ncbi:MAG: MEDS domain-containing protein, partial [Thermodesulfovibrionales bacterium]
GLRRSGIDIIGDVPWGTHFCQFYRTEEDLTAILVPYFKAGLENNEFCLWVTSEPLSGQEAETALRKALPDLDHYLSKGQIEIIPHSEWYLKEGIFDAERVLKGWVEKLNHALIKGYDGLRLTGNTFWLEKAGWRDFVAYEETVDSVIGRYRMIGICTYSLDRCSAVEAIDVVKNHQFALTRRDGQWELIESSERRRALDALSRSEARYRLLFENMLAGVAFCRMELDDLGRPVDCVLIEANQAFERQTSLLRDETVGKRMTEALPGIEKDPADWIGAFGRVAMTGEAVRFDQYLEPLGRWYAVAAYSPIRGYIVIVFDDITERKRAEEALRGAYEELETRVQERTEELRRAKADLETRVRERTAELLDIKDDLEVEILARREKEGQIEKALQEKETLLRELYHRTKNNMNVISGLITLQTASLRDDRSLQMFRDLQGRITSMSLVHQKLYQAGDLSNVSLRDYVDDLSKALLNSYRTTSGKVALKLDIESFSLSIDAIIPCGLVINELMSNSLKYAFPGGRDGEIRIEGLLTGEGEIRISYSDNGIGLPEGIDLHKTKTLGLKLVKKLTEGQLGGRVQLKDGPDPGFLLTFREPHYIRRI